MKHYNIKDMTRGWFVGSFMPTAFNTIGCEVAFMTHRKGEITNKHYHKKSTEINLIVKGRVMVTANSFDEECGCQSNDHMSLVKEAGCIFVIEPLEITICEFLEDTEMVVVKVPGVLGDKYLV